MSTVVVYVHGLWLRGHEAVLLRRRLARALGADTRSFAYHSVTANLADNVAALAAYLTGIRADTLHLVGHSLGGLLLLELFERAPPLPPGRLVLLGSPVGGSRSARRLRQLPFVGARLLGLTGAEVLLDARARRWSGMREVGVIAGDLGFGLGRLLGPLDDHHDGTVRVAETHLPGATAHVTLRVSHSGMAFSEAVARQTAAFLRDGRFEA